MVKSSPQSVNPFESITDFDAVFKDKIVEYKSGNIPQQVPGGVSYAQRLSDFVEQQIVLKGSKLVSAINEGEFHPDDSPTNLTIPDVRSIRSVEFWLSGKGTDFEVAVNGGIDELNNEFGSKGFNFRVQFGVSKPSWAK